jgi:hypothetical protein
MPIYPTMIALLPILSIFTPLPPSGLGCLRLAQVVSTV